jgi:hypothetical protein
MDWGLVEPTTGVSYEDISSIDGVVLKAFCRAVCCDLCVLDASVWAGLRSWLCGLLKKVTSNPGWALVIQ